MQGSLGLGTLVFNFWVGNGGSRISGLGAFCYAVDAVSVVGEVSAFFLVSVVTVVVSLVPAEAEVVTLVAG